MESGWTQDLLAWVAENPGWTGVLVFALACIESLVLIGILIPGIVILFGVGAMIGLGAIDMAPIWILGTLGAFLGDGISYMVGRRNREQLIEVWPFSRYPALLEKGSVFFTRHGNKSIFAGRFIGPLRPIIPATAGMLGMKPSRFLSVDIPACILWSPAYLLPGMLFGASLEMATEYAGRLSLVLVILVVALWLAWWLMWAVYDFLFNHSAQLLARAVRWSHRHHYLGRAARQILDPDQPEALSVASLGLVLVVVFWTIALLLFFSPFSAQPVAIDQAVLAQAQALRNHIADPILVSIMQLSHWWVLLPAPAAVLLYLLGARQMHAAIHWLVAIVGGVLLQLVLGWTLKSTPVLQSAGMDEFYVPSSALTLTTVVHGFFTVMLAREVREDHQKWPYLVSAVVMTLLALSRLYLGLDWLSGALVAILLGFTWTGIVGIAYRLRAEGSFSGPIVGTIFGVTLAISLAWQIVQNLDEDLTALEPLLPAAQQSESHWWEQGWAHMPRERTQFEAVSARRFNAQIALDLDEIRDALAADGWREPESANWQWMMKALNPDPTIEELPLLGKDYIGRPEVLKMSLPGDSPRVQYSMRVWDSGVRLGSAQQAVYLAQMSQESVEQRLAFFSYWKAVPVDASRLRGLAVTLSDYYSQLVDVDLYLVRRTPPTGIEAESSTGAPTARLDRPSPTDPDVPDF